MVFWLIFFRMFLISGFLWWLMKLMKNMQVYLLLCDGWVLMWVRLILLLWNGISSLCRVFGLLCMEMMIEVLLLLVGGIFWLLMIRKCVELFGWFLIFLCSLFRLYRLVVMLLVIVVEFYLFFICLVVLVLFDIVICLMFGQCEFSYL